jgi:DNA-binding GntR family transcriptional regulator
MIRLPEVPKNRRVANDLRQQIRTGKLKPGAQLPTYPEIASRYDVSEAVARNAVALLAREGLVKTSQGVAGATVLEASAPTASPETAQRLDDHEQRIADLELQVMEIRARLGADQPRQQQRPRKAANQ